MLLILTVLTLNRPGKTIVSSVWTNSIALPGRLVFATVTISNGAVPANMNREIPDPSSPKRLIVSWANAGVTRHETATSTKNRVFIIAPLIGNRTRIDATRQGVAPALRFCEL